jgi:hypothetical protein
LVLNCNVNAIVSAARLGHSVVYGIGGLTMFEALRLA